MENISRHIAAKFDLAEQLIKKLTGAIDPSNGSNTQCTAPLSGDYSSIRPIYPLTEDTNVLYLELETIRTRYTLCTSHLFLLAVTGESGRLAAREEFQRIVASENFLGELNYLVRRVQVELGITKDDLSSIPMTRSRGRTRLQSQRNNSTIPSYHGLKGTTEVRDQPPQNLVREVKHLLDQYECHEVDCAATTVEHSFATHGEQYNICSECRMEMVVNSETSELTCAGCGKVRELIGTVFDDAQFYNQEGQKAKSGSFNPNRHFRFWMDRILAREPEEELGDKDDPDNTYGERLLEQLLGIVRRDRKILRFITVDSVRAMLKEAGRTDLNKNVPLIMRRLTGVGPPQLPEFICQRVEKLFSKAIEIGERVRPAGRTNRNYYPYYIYKILDAILPEETDTSDTSESSEHRRVLYYIYMQGQDTLDKNDREWEEICMELPEIEWAPTYRSKAHRYRPL